jgi:hypothetical protein
LMATRNSNDTSNSNSKDGEDLSELHLYRSLEVILKSVELNFREIVERGVRLSVWWRRSVFEGFLGEFIPLLWWRNVSTAEGRVPFLHGTITSLRSSYCTCIELHNKGTDLVDRSVLFLRAPPRGQLKGLSLKRCWEISKGADWSSVRRQRSVANLWHWNNEYSSPNRYFV